MKFAVSSLSNGELSVELERLATTERSSTIALIVHLAEFDARKLHLAAAFPSLYRYCRHVLKLSEHEAYHRIVAARVGRRFPIVMDLLAAAELTLTSVRLLAPHLTRGNHRSLLKAARGKSKREVQTLLASWFPKPDVPTSIRPIVATMAAAGGSTPSLAFGLPAAATGVADSRPAASSLQATPAGAPCHAAAESRGERPLAPPPLSGPDPAKPLSPDRYEFHFSGPAAAYEKLQRVQDLLRHRGGKGDVGEIFDRALSALIKEVEKERFALTDRPRSAAPPTVAPAPPAAVAPEVAAAVVGEPVPEAATSTVPPAKAATRYVPAGFKRVVFTRDEGRCKFRSGSRRCEARSQLEYHHVIPWEVGGPTTPDNLELRCRAHNNYEAERYFGPLRRAHEVHLEAMALPALARTFRPMDSARAESPLAEADLTRRADVARR